MCRVILTSEHFSKHGVDVPNVPELLAELQTMIRESSVSNENRCRRDLMINILASKVKEYISVMKKFLNADSNE